MDSSIHLPLGQVDFISTALNYEQVKEREREAVSQLERMCDPHMYHQMDLH